MKKMKFSGLLTLTLGMSMTMLTMPVKAIFIEEGIAPEIKEIKTVTPPVAIAATDISSNSFKANWNEVASASTYYIRVVDESTQDFVLLDQETTNNYFMVSNLKSKNGYHYAVKVKVGDEISEISNWIELTTMQTAPVAKAATEITSGSFTANWDDVNGATSFLLRVVDSETQEFILKDISLQAYSYKVTGLKSKHSYSYAVIAGFDSGEKSELSNWIDVTTDVSTKIGNQKNSTLRICPNPANCYLVVDGITIGSKVNVVSVSGNVVKSIDVKQDNETISLEGIEKGLYLLVVTNKKGQQFQEKFMVE